MNGKFLIIFILIINLFGVEVNVDKRNVIEGDSIAFSITASGENIEFPVIRRIDNYPIEAKSTSQNIEIINNKYKKTITKTYIFTPTKSITIPSYKVIIDGQIEYTKPIKIKVFKDNKTLQDFKLEIDTKKEAIVGYPNIIVIKFYQKTNVKIGSAALEVPSGDFQLVQIGEKTYFEGIYKVTEVKYKFIPLKEGKINFIVKLKLGFAIQQVDPLGFIISSVKYKTIQKNVVIDAKKVYDGLIGDFNISISADKTKVKANIPVNVTLKITGEGDFHKLGDIKLDIPNVTIYDNKPIIKSNSYTKAYVIVADRNYTITPLSLKYYSIKDKQVKTISTKPIFVEVTNSMPIVKPYTIKEKVITKIEYKINYIYLIISFIIGSLIGYLISKIKFKQKFKLPLDLYTKLLPYADNPQIKEVLNKLYKKEKLSKEDREFLKEFFNENKRDI